MASTHSRSAPTAVTSRLKTSAGDIDYNNISFENQMQQVLTNEIINKNFGNSGLLAVYVNFDPNNLKGASVSTYVSQAKNAL